MGECKEPAGRLARLAANFASAAGGACLATAAPAGSTTSLGAVARGPDGERTSRGGAVSTRLVDGRPGRLALAGGALLSALGFVCFAIACPNPHSCSKNARRYTQGPRQYALLTATAHTKSRWPRPIIHPKTAPCAHAPANRFWQQALTSFGTPTTPPNQDRSPIRAHLASLIYHNLDRAIAQYEA